MRAISRQFDRRTRRGFSPSPSETARSWREPERKGMNKQIYAVGLKNYIELRTASKPPQLKVTKKTKEAKLTYTDWEYDGYRTTEVLRTIKRLIPITCSTFVGGRFLGSLKRRKSLSGKLTCGVGKVIEVSPELAASLLGQPVGR
jgi:hypothetical protein